MRLTVLRVMEPPVDALCDVYDEFGEESEAWEAWWVDGNSGCFFDGMAVRVLGYGPRDVQPQHDFRKDYASHDERDVICHEAETEFS